MYLTRPDDSRVSWLLCLVFCQMVLLIKCTVDGMIKCTAGEIVGKRKELRVKRELFELLVVVLEVCDKLKLLKNDIRNGRVEEAAKALRKLKVALRVDDDDESGLVLYQILRKEWHNCFEEMQDTLVMLVQHAIKFEPSGNFVRVKHWLTMNEDEKIELCTVLKAMDAVGDLNYGLAKVADLMIKHIVSPSIVCGASVAVMDEISNDDQRNTEEVLKVVPSTRDTIDDLDCEKLFSSLILIVEFIYKSICCQDGQWMRCFGRLTWPRMSEMIISNFLSKVVPDDASKFSDFQTSQNFHRILKQNTNSPLMGKETAKNLFDNSVNLLFTSEKCIVSEAALSLMELVHKVLKDTCLSSVRVGLELYRAAIDSLLLYEAVIPVKLEKQLDTIDQAAVLVHNDCLYLSQDILGLAF